MRNAYYAGRNQARLETHDMRIASRKNGRQQFETGCDKSTIEGTAVQGSKHLEEMMPCSVLCALRGKEAKLGKRCLRGPSMCVCVSEISEAINELYQSNDRVSTKEHNGMTLYGILQTWIQLCLI